MCLTKSYVDPDAPLLCGVAARRDDAGRGQVLVTRMEPQKKSKQKKKKKKNGKDAPATEKKKEKKSKKHELAFGDPMYWMHTCSVTVILLRKLPKKGTVVSVYSLYVVGFYVVVVGSGWTVSTGQCPDTRGEVCSTSVQHFLHPRFRSCGPRVELSTSALKRVSKRLPKKRLALR